MQDIQEIFSRLQEKKKKQKDIKASFKDALSTSLEYKEVADNIKALREKKKRIESTIKSQFSGELNKLDEIKTDVASDNVMLTDSAVTKMMKGETVEVADEYGNKYEPLFSVKFKKV